MQAPAAGGGTMQNNLGIVYAVGAHDFAATKDPGVSTVLWNRIGPWQHGFLVSAIGWAWDLDVCPLANQSNHRSVRDFGYRFSVGSCGIANDGSGYSWRRADTYYEPIGLPSATVVGQWEIPASFLATWRDVYTNNLTYFGATDLDDSSTSTQALQIGPQGDGGFGTGDQPWLPADLSVASQQVATRAHFAPLSFAIDHGYAGAQAAFTRVFDSLSYNDVTADQTMADFPRYVITPR